MNPTTPLALTAVILAAIGTTLAVVSTLIWVRRERREKPHAPAKLTQDAEDTPEYLWAYHIVGEHCGRDGSGVFRCFCGKCTPVRIDLSVNPRPSVIDSHEGKDCCCNGSERGHGCNCGRDYEASFLRASL